MIEQPATRIGENTYSYDANGNQTGWRDDKNVTRRQVLWDEENRMRAIADNGVAHHYIYDAAGERVIKSTGDGQAIYINGFPMGGSGTVGSYTMYVNPYVVVQNAKYTKHFYIEGQRIVSKLGEMGSEQELLQPKVHAGDSLKSPVNWNDKKELSKDIIISGFEALGLSGAVFTAGKSGKLPYGQIKKYYRNSDAVINPGTNSTKSNKTEDLQFYYHPDHLGSSNYITDASGEVYQHQEYFPFGETFVEERNDAEYTNYLYNGKELDAETGLYYYGARYYDPRTSVWQSVDPLAEKYPEVSSYVYCHNNPINIFDPDGKTDYNVTEDGTIVKAHSFVDAVKKFFDIKDDNDKIIKDNKSVTLAAGSIGEIKTKDYTDESGDSKNGQFFTIQNKSEADKAYNFLAENTDVEWSQIDSKDKQGSQSTIATSRQSNTEYLGPLLAGEKLKSGGNISVMTHSHPYDPAIPALGESAVSQEDMNNAQFYKDKYPGQNIIFRSYDVRGG